MASVLPRDLDNGLRLRRATAADAERLATFNSRIHQPPESAELDFRGAAWTRDLCLRPPPGFDVGDITIVEDTRTGEIASSLNLISQTWTYAGVPFDVGHPELVGTDPRYRRRGLVRIQMDLIHQWSAERGQKVQAITGIPFFYRQFGYEMALSLGGGRAIHRSVVPRLPDGATEPYQIRPASDRDIPFLTGLYDDNERRYVVSCRRTETDWRYELAGRSPDSGPRRELRVIEDRDGAPVGVIGQLPFLTDSGDVYVTFYALAPGSSWLAVTPTVTRYLERVGAELAANSVPRRELGGVGFGLGEDHPCYAVLGDRFVQIGNPYAWYIRLPDVPDFLRHVRPALERRLAESIVPGHTGELKLSFFDEGCRIVFERGRVTAVEEWQPSLIDRGHLTFPGLTFLNLLFGYRTIADLEYAYADCRARSIEARVLANALFPRAPSAVWPIE